MKHYLNKQLLSKYFINKGQIQYFGIFSHNQNDDNWKKYDCKAELVTERYNFMSLLKSGAQLGQANRI